MPPGGTSRLLALTISAAGPRSAPSTAILPQLMPTSQENVSDAVATVPPRMTVSNAKRYSLSPGAVLAGQGLDKDQTVMLQAGNKAGRAGLKTGKNHSA